MRILNKAEKLLSIKDLGMHEDDFLKIKGLSMKSHGIVLIAGPVGTGKTTTLYSIILDSINSGEKRA